MNRKVVIAIVSPVAKSKHTGNAVTSARWARLLRAEGHRVSVSSELPSRRFDVLVALHARKSHHVIAESRRRFADRPIVVMLTGTDVYGDIGDPAIQDSLELADAIVVLQREALKRLTRAQRKKAVVVHQSAVAEGPVGKARDGFEVAFVANLRDEKDPLLPAEAAALLPDESKIVIVHAGAGLDESILRELQRKESSRYHYAGEMSHLGARRLIARSRALVVSSKMEGGANVIAEAIVAGVPVLASKIDGNVGMLGRSYRGYFAPGDARALARLLARIERDPAFLRELRGAVAKVRANFSERAERRALAKLIRSTAIVAARKT